MNTSGGPLRREIQVLCGKNVIFLTGAMGEFQSTNPINPKENTHLYDINQTRGDSNTKMKKSFCLSKIEI
jgi:hypothetical protein